MISYIKPRACAFVHCMTTYNILLFILVLVVKYQSSWLLYHVYIWQKVAKFYYGETEPTIIFYGSEFVLDLFCMYVMTLRLALYVLSWLDTVWQSTLHDHCGRVVNLSANPILGIVCSLHILYKMCCSNLRLVGLTLCLIVHRLWGYYFNF